MRILLTKLSDRRHALEVVRGDGSRERVELVTREALIHDLLHHAVESSMPTQGGFWGSLASGRTMADLRGRSGVDLGEGCATLAAVEQAVGMMSGALKGGGTEAEAVAALRRYHEALGQEAPGWCTEGFVVEVRERLRRLQGRWRATPYGESMEIPWVEAPGGEGRAVDTGR